MLFLVILKSNLVGKKTTAWGLRKPVFTWRPRRQEKPDDSGLLLAFKLPLFGAWVVN